MLCLYNLAMLSCSFGFLLSGFFLLVSHINQTDPAIGHLMPALNSPLLSIHVRCDHTASKRTNRCSQAPDCLQLYV